MVDGKEGMTAADREVASMLMKTGKKIVLAVNKIDKSGSCRMIFMIFMSWDWGNLSRFPQPTC